jgi:hypothetical protein
MVIMDGKHIFKLFFVVVMVTIFCGTALNPGLATAAPLYASVTVTADSLAKSGIPGSVVAYTLTLENSEATEVTLTLEGTTAGGWPAPTIVPSSVVIPAGESRPAVVNVPVPAEATAGQNDVATIIVKDDTLAEVGLVMLTTTAKAPPSQGRPIIAVSSYSSSPNPIKPYQEFSLSVVFENRGSSTAYNVIVAFEGTDLYPRGTGGVSTTSSLGGGSKTTFTQTFLTGGNLTWQEVAIIKATASYSDGSGQPYTETFTLTLGITAPVYYAATATPVTQDKPQLVITGYETDVDPLQPGSIFDLKIDVTNLGKADAKAVTMVLGGGVSPGDQSGTPQAGGVLGSSGDLTNFAPLNSSNLVFIGDIKQGETISTSGTFVTNVSTQPGVYTLKVSYLYSDAKGNRIVDDQVITLLVFSLPQVEISFYRDAGEFLVGMPGTLPLQVTNLSKKTAVLGNMKVSAENASLFNDVLLVGALEPGGYYTLDTEITPMQEGPLDLIVTINYTDDFNQPRSVTQALTVNVMPAPEVPEGLEGEGGVVEPGEPVVEQPQTFWSVIWRFVKGLFGLGSGVKQEIPQGGEEIAPEEFISPARPGKG